jgi:hypothetical protein
LMEEDPNAEKVEEGIMVLALLKDTEDPKD